MSQRFYVTTPIYYVNGAPHIGHAYTTLVADALARYHKLRGHHTHFLTGTDEHGLKIQREAEKRGMTALDFATENADRFRALWPVLGARPDDFLRTTEPRHMEAVQRWWKVCVDRGDIYLGRYKGLYCVACEGYKTEKELLPGGLCPVHERPIETLEEETYFFRLSHYADKLLALYRDTPEFLQPDTRRNEMISFVSQGLDDLSISRTTFDWGIPVPGDPRHVMYVWFDALFNYRSAIEGTEAEAFWPPNAQLVAKDILRFHTVYWPAFLMSAGLPLPKTVFSHGYVLSGGKKTSKTPGAGPRLSTGTTDPVRIAAAVGSDALRYYLLREIAFGQDGEFSLPSLLGRVRSELAETVGNLLHRTLPFVAKHFDGRVPAVEEALTEAETTLRTRAEAIARDAATAWDTFAPHRALELTQELARAGNQYFDTQTPWKLAKDPAQRPRLAVVIAHVLELLHTVAVLLSPALPDGADALCTQLGIGALVPSRDTDRWPLAWGTLPAGTLLQPGAPIFPKYDAATEAALLASLDVHTLTDEPTAVTDPTDPVVADTAPPAAAPAETAPAETAAAFEPLGATIAFDDFAKIDLRVGTVLTAERIPKKDMLLKLSVDLGEPTGPRTILAGIAKAFAPEALVGRQVVVVANLAPRDFGKGLVSHGMLLASGPKDGLTLAGFDKPIAPGTRVK